MGRIGGPQGWFVYRVDSEVFFSKKPNRKNLEAFSKKEKLRGVLIACHRQNTEQVCDGRITRAGAMSVVTAGVFVDHPHHAAAASDGCIHPIGGRCSFIAPRQ